MTEKSASRIWEKRRQRLQSSTRCNLIRVLNRLCRCFCNATIIVTVTLFRCLCSFTRTCMFTTRVLTHTSACMQIIKCTVLLSRDILYAYKNVGKYITLPVYNVYNVFAVYTRALYTYTFCNGHDRCHNHRCTVFTRVRTRPPRITCIYYV